MTRAGAALDLQPIDRLEEKVRQLVALVDSLRAERGRAVEDATRLQRELDQARARLGDIASASAEVATLKEERELVRARVAHMLTQIDKLSL